MSIFLEVKLLFALFDVDNSGTLTGEELKQLLQSPDPDGPELTEEQVADYLKSADIDGEIQLISLASTGEKISFQVVAMCLSRNSSLS